MGKLCECDNIVVNHKWPFLALSSFSSFSQVCTDGQQPNKQTRTSHVPVAALLIRLDKGFNGDGTAAAIYRECRNRSKCGVRHVRKSIRTMFVVVRHQWELLNIIMSGNAIATCNVQIAVCNVSGKYIGNMALERWRRGWLYVYMIPYCNLHKGPSKT